MAKDGKKSAWGRLKSGAGDLASGFGHMVATSVKKTIAVGGFALGAYSMGKGFLEDVQEGTWSGTFDDKAGLLAKGAGTLALAYSGVRAFTGGIGTGVGSLVKTGGAVAGGYVLGQIYEGVKDFAGDDREVATDAAYVTGEEAQDDGLSF